MRQLATGFLMVFILSFTALNLAFAIMPTHMTALVLDMAKTAPS